MNVAVYPVGNDATLKAGYVDVVWQIYKGDPYWVPPLKADVKKTMDARVNPFFQYAEVEHFVALGSAGQVVGRIAATLYPPYNQHYCEKAGFFGFFESPPDQTVANALLTTVEAWARAHDLDTLVGPYNYCSTQEMGLLIDGYDTPPALFQPHNPPYYRHLLESRGYAPDFCMSTYKWSVADDARREELDRGDAVVRAANLIVRSVDMRKFAREAETLRILFNQSFAENHAVLPIERDVFAFQAAALKPFVDRRLIRIVEQAGKPVAFALLAPNMNEVLKRLNGRIGPRIILDKLTGRLQRSVKSAVVLLIGGLPELNGVGLGRVLTAELSRSVMNTQYQTVHTTWVDERNFTSLALLTRLRALPVKRYAMYRRALR